MSLLILASLTLVAIATTRLLLQPLVWVASIHLPYGFWLAIAVGLISWCLGK